MNEKKMRTYYLTVYYTPESEGGDKQDQGQLEDPLLGGHV